MALVPSTAREQVTGSALLPVATLIGAMVSIQFGATLAKNLFPVVGATGTTALRLTVGAILLTILLRPWTARPSRRVLPALIGYGLVLGAMNWCFYMSIRTIPLGVAVALEFSGPLTVAVLASRRTVDFAWIGLAVIGLMLLSPAIRTTHPLDPLGLTFALAAGAFWALYIIFGQKAGEELGTQTTAIGMIIAALLILPLGIVRGGDTLLRPGVLMSAVGVGVFSGALPFSLEMMALTRLPTKVYSTLTSLEPAIGALMGLVLLHESLTVLQWLGIAVVIVAALGATTSAKAPVVSPE